MATLIVLLALFPSSNKMIRFPLQHLNTLQSLPIVRLNDPVVKKMSKKIKRRVLAKQIQGMESSILRINVCVLLRYSLF